MAFLWQPGRKVAIKAVDQGKYVFQFFHKLDMQRVINGGPWSFDGHLLLLSQIGQGMIPSQVPLFQATFWVQVHDIPVGMMTKKVGEGLGKFMGELVEYDAKNSSNFWRNYMRIKVNIDVRKPLRRGKKISTMDGGTSIVRFKYERLTLFCYLCGILGHGDYTCEKLFQMEEDDGVRKWGPELKADKRRGNSGNNNKWLCEEVGGSSSSPMPAPATAAPSQSSGSPTMNVQETRAIMTAGTVMERQLMHGRTVMDNVNNYNNLHGTTIITPFNGRQVSTNHANQHIDEDVTKSEEELIDKKRKRNKQRGVATSGVITNNVAMEIESNNNNTNISHQHFLEVGPGSQAHRDQ
jgi:14-3-3 protein epsilon